MCVDISAEIEHSDDRKGIIFECSKALKAPRYNSKRAKEFVSRGVNGCASTEL